MEAVVPLHNREINSQWQDNWSWRVGQPQLRLSGSFLSLGIMKGSFFNLVFCMKTNFVLLAAYVWMRAWVYLVNIKAWPGQSIFWHCFWLDCISHIWISDAAPTALSLESWKLSIQVLHVSTSLWELSQNFQFTPTPHQWLPRSLLHSVLASASTGLHPWFLLVWPRPCSSERPCAFLC